MTEQYMLGKIEQLTPNSDFWERFKDCHFEIRPRFEKCQEILEVKAKSITKDDGGITVEFASEEDSNLFWYSKRPIRIVLER